MADKVDASQPSGDAYLEESLKGFTIMFADLLVPGRGEPQHEAALVSDMERIHYVGSQSRLPAKYQQLTPIGVPVLMPGLWDCHEHLVCLMSAVRLQMRAGARFIKICATGGVGGMLNDPEKCQHSDAELRAFVEEENRSGCIVAAHCHDKSGIMTALHAGIRTIGHGTYLDDQSIRLMVKKGVILVPTRTIKKVLVQIAHAMNPHTQKKILKSEPVQKEAYRKAITTGVTIALGADLGMSAIEAATANFPLTLGPQAPLSGQLKEGYDADFIALAKNPLENIAVVLDADNCTHVWRRGKLYKAPGKPVVPPVP